MIMMLRLRHLNAWIPDSSSPIFAERTTALFSFLFNQVIFSSLKIHFRPIQSKPIFQQTSPLPPKRDFPMYT